jgi:hypothetical protein
MKVLKEYKVKHDYHMRMYINKKEKVVTTCLGASCSLCMLHLGGDRDGGLKYIMEIGSR